MGRLEFKLGPSPVSLPFNDEIEPIRGFGANKPIIAKAGSETWFVAELEISSEYQYTRLDAEFLYDENDPVDCIHRGRAGFWIGVKDQIASVEFGSPVFDCGLTDDISVKVNEWNFGKKPRIEFVTEKHNYSCKKVKFGICVSPYFNVVEEKPQVCKLEFRLSGMKHGGYMMYEPLETKVISFEGSKNASIQGEALKLRLMKDFKGFDTQGNGNSIHPKQLCTLTNLEYELNSVDGPVVLSYIGTDTTENIRSVIRYLKSKQELYSKISELMVYKTEKYDLKIEEDEPNLALKQEMSEDYFKLEIETLPSDGTLPDNVKAANIIISTYVTPWAITDDKQQYKDLISKLMSKPGSILIAVDPSSPEFIVRSTTDGNEFNLDSFYEDDMKLQSRKNHHIKMKNKSTQALIWSRQGAAL